MPIRASSDMLAEDEDEVTILPREVAEYKARIGKLEHQLATSESNGPSSLEPQQQPVMPQSKAPPLLEP